MKPPPKPSLFGSDCTVAMLLLMKVKPPSLDTPANARYFKLFGSPRRSRKVTPTSPRELTFTQGKNWSWVSVEGATVCCALHVVPPTLELTTRTLTTVPVQCQNAKYSCP